MGLLAGFRSLGARIRQRLDRAETTAALANETTDQTILIELVGGGPKDGRRQVIDRSELEHSPQGVVWHGGRRPTYVFETPPEYVQHGAEFRNCYQGRFVGWEKT